jgi:hypothetical protein
MSARPKATEVLERGCAARIVHARVAVHCLGWACELRDRSLGRRPDLPAAFRNAPEIERRAMRDLALSFRADLALVHSILEASDETVSRALLDERIDADRERRPRGKPAPQAEGTPARVGL